MKNSTLLTSLFALLLFNANALDYFWTNSSGNNQWADPTNWTCSDPNASYPNNINNDRAFLLSASSGDCEVNQLIQVQTIEIGPLYDGEVSIKNVFIVRDQFNVYSPNAVVKAPNTHYIGIRGSAYFHSGSNFQHSNGTVKFYGGYHNIQLGSGTANPWILHDVEVTREPHRAPMPPSY